MGRAPRVGGGEGDFLMLTSLLQNCDGGRELTFVLLPPRARLKKLGGLRIFSCSQQKKSGIDQGLAALRFARRNFQGFLQRGLRPLRGGHRRQQEPPLVVGARKSGGKFADFFELMRVPQIVENVVVEPVGVFLIQLLQFSEFGHSFFQRRSGGIADSVGVVLQKNRQVRAVVFVFGVKFHGFAIGGNGVL